MTLKEQLMADFKEAMKAKDEVAKNTISFARAAVKQYEVDHREELDDAGIVAILAKQVKMRKDALADFEKEVTELKLATYKTIAQLNLDNSKLTIENERLQRENAGMKEIIESLSRLNREQSEAILDLRVQVKELESKSKHWN